MTGHNGTPPQSDQDFAAFLDFCKHQDPDETTLPSDLNPIEDPNFFSKQMGYLKAGHMGVIITSDPNGPGWSFMLIKMNPAGAIAHLSAIITRLAQAMQANDD